MKKIMFKSSLFILSILGLLSWKMSTSEINKSNFLSANPVPEIQQADATNVSKSKIQVALILDTSGSMSGLIEQAKSQLWNIVNELSKAKKDSTSPQIQLALYQYGNDGLSINDGYIQQILPFGTDLDMLSEKLFGLSTNGGSEYCGMAIQKSLKELDWDSDSSSIRMVYIAGNESFLQGPISYDEVCAKAKEKEVLINAIYCGPHRQGLMESWDKATQCNGGNFMNIDSDQTIVHVATPYDATISQLNVQLNQTYVNYGSQGKKYKANQLKQDDNSFKYGNSNYTKRAISKSNKVYDNGHWDLVDAYTKDSLVVQKIDKKHSQNSLQNHSNAELQSFIVLNQNNRMLIQQEINQNALLREKYIAENSKTNQEETLGNSMIKVIHEQAKKKGYSIK